jgi:putative tryptophan/tyrosine transport system substrate-binding protein
MEAFRDGLGKLGYIEGQNIAVLDRLAEGKVDRLPELAVERVRLKVDVIVTGGTITTYAAKRATSTIPIDMAVAVLSNPANRSSGPGLSTTKAAAQSMGLQLVPIEVRGPGEFESAFSAIARARAQALVLEHQDPIFHVHAQRVASLALKSRLPAVFYLKDFAEYGGLMSYAPSYTDLFRRAAVYVDKILTRRWANPAAPRLRRSTVPRISRSSMSFGARA